MRGVWETEKVKINPKGKEQLNTWKLGDYLRNSFMLGIKIPFWLLQHCIFFIPLKNNRIILYSLKQHGYSCNLKYLTEYIRKNCSNEFEFAWVVKNSEDLDCLRRHNIPAVRLHSIEHLFFRFRAKVVITNDEFYPLFIKRKGQIYVNTWHGGINYKQIGYSGLSFSNKLQEKIYRLGNPQPELFVSGSKAFTESTSKAFRFPKHIFLNCGLPRNDLFFGDYNTASQRIKKRLRIPEYIRLLLYAPTFRRGKSRPPYEPDYNQLANTLQERFGGQWKILVRYHYFSSENLELEKNNAEVINVSTYEDMQELIICSDCMISDYSSSMWDFSYTGRPCFVYAPDLKEYMEQDRSFSIPPSQWPYPICQDLKQLHQAILEFDEITYKQKLQEHHKLMGSYDRGHSCRELVDKINVLRRGLVL